MMHVELYSRAHGLKQRCLPSVHRLAVLPDRLVNADTGEVIVVKKDNRWWRQSEIAGQWADQAHSWEFPMVVSDS